MFLYLTNVPSRTIHTRQTKNRKCETQEQNFQRAADDVIFSNGRNNKFLPRQYTYLVHQYHCKFALRSYPQRVQYNQNQENKRTLNLCFCNVELKHNSSRQIHRIIINNYGMRDVNYYQRYVFEINARCVLTTNLKVYENLKLMQYG